MSSIMIIKFLDKVVGSVICIILSIFSKEKSANKSKKILFIQLWGIGESILTLPSIEAIRRKFKYSDISVLATHRNKEVYNSSKVNILTIDLNPISILKFIINNFKKFDIVIDFEEYLNISSIISFFTGKHRVGFSHNIRGKTYNQTVNYNDKIHCSKTFLKLVEVFNASYDKIPKIKYKESNKVNNLLKEKNIGIVPGAAESAKSRMWPKERYIELIRNLKGNIILIGSDKEKGLLNEIELATSTINTAGKLSLNELFHLIDKLDLLISNDTGPLHIASAMGTKTIGLFGPNTPIRFGPLTKGSISIYKPACKYSPCINVHKGEVPDCLKIMKDINEYQKCMKQIKVDDVLKVIKKLNI